MIFGKKFHSVLWAKKKIIPPCELLLKLSLVIHCSITKQQRVLKYLCKLCWSQCFRKVLSIHLSGLAWALACLLSRWLFPTLNKDQYEWEIADLVISSEQFSSGGVNFLVWLLLLLQTQAKSDCLLHLLIDYWTNV